jgi:hypothetical protein
MSLRYRSSMPHPDDDILPDGTCRLVLLFILAVPALGSIFSADTASATIMNAYGGPESSAFQLAGPQLNLTASGANIPGYNTLQNLNASFNLSLSLLISDDGFESGSAIAGGTIYPSLAFSNTGTLIINTLSPITITTTNLTFTTAATLSGSLHACATAFNCINGGPTSSPFDVSIPPINGLLTVTYANINPPFSTQYALKEAVFTTTPEPGTWIAGFGLLAALATRKLKRRRRLSAPAVKCHLT